MNQVCSLLSAPLLCVVQCMDACITTLDEWSVHEYNINHEENAAAKLAAQQSDSDVDDDDDEFSDDDCHNMWSAEQLDRLTRARNAALGRYSGKSLPRKMMDEFVGQRDRNLQQLCAHTVLMSSDMYLDFIEQCCDAMDDDSGGQRHQAYARVGHVLELMYVDVDADGSLRSLLTCSTVTVTERNFGDYLQRWDGGRHRRRGRGVAIRRLDIAWATPTLNMRLLCNLVRPVGGDQLRSLDLSGCSFLPSTAVSAAVRLCPRLEELDVSGVEELKCAALGVVARHCPLLRSFKARRCYALSDAGVVALVRSCVYLDCVNLSLCHALTPAAIVELAEQCPALVVAELNGLRGAMTSAAAIALAKNCAMMTQLSMTDAPISDRAVERIARGMPLLAKIVLRSCVRLTDRSIRVLAQLGGANATLSYIDVYRCPRINPDAIAVAIQHLPTLRVYLGSKGVFATRLNNTSKQFFLRSSIELLDPYAVSHCNDDEQQQQDDDDSLQTAIL
jgi:hypothetical protein